MILISTQAFPPSSGGIQTLMVGLAQAAARLEKVLVLADGKSDAREYGKASNAAYDVQRFAGLKPLRRRKKAQAIKTMCQTHNVSQIICDSWKSAELLSNAIKVPVLAYAHGNEYPLGAQGVKKKDRIAKALRRIDHLIAVSHPTAKRVEVFRPQQNGPELHVRPNPVTTPTPASQEDKDYAQSLWAKIGTKETDKRLLCLARLIDWKGMDAAIEALKELRANNHGAKLIIAGTGPDEARLKALSAKHGLENHLLFAGRVEGGRKSALFESADIYMQAGRRVGDQCEGFGITYIEAGLHGLPSIAGCEGGAPDAVKHGQTGLVVNGVVQDEVTNAVRQLIDEPALAHQMGEAAQSHARELLWDKQIGQILNLAKEDKGTHRG